MFPRYLFLSLSFLLPATAQEPEATPVESTPTRKAKVVAEERPAAPPAVRKARPLQEAAETAKSKESQAEAARKEAERLQMKDPETALRVQIFLDSVTFGPGKIDGDIGEFTKKAAQLYNEVNSHPKDSWTLILHRSAQNIKELTTTYELKDNDFRFLVPELPEKPAEQAEYRYMGYRTIEEFVAERFHTSEGFLMKLNPTVKFRKLAAGAKLVVPNVRQPFEIEEVPYSQGYDAEEPMSERRVLLDTKERMASFYDEKGNLIACLPITPGKDKFIKPGEFELKKMITTPEFRYDKSMLERGERGEDYHQLPPGPNSPVGIFWASTSRNGIGLHGTSTPHAIGRGQSAGCVRFANWDAVRLPSLIRPGAKLVMR